MKTFLKSALVTFALLLPVGLTVMDEVGQLSVVNGVSMKVISSSIAI